VTTGLKDAGYQYINLDCGYSTGFRGADGSLTVNTTRYPHGMKWLGDQLHGMGLKYGLYSDAGKQQCCSRVYGPDVNDGSLGVEAQDAAQFASWGIDLLKVGGSTAGCTVGGARAQRAVPEHSGQRQSTSGQRQSTVPARERPSRARTTNNCQPLTALALCHPLPMPPSPPASMITAGLRRRRTRRCATH
jgi:hypothetical protein